MTIDLWITILSSSLFTGIVGALIAGWFVLRGKQTDYANSYYMLVLERRLAAYEEIERLITFIKVAVVDEDNRPYHLLFSKDDDHEQVFKLTFAVMSHTLWLSDDLFASIRDLNMLIYSHPDDMSGLIDFGKQNYLTISGLRTKIEKLRARDLLTLHNVPKFLKGKEFTDSYSVLPDRGPRVSA